MIVDPGTRKGQPQQELRALLEQGKTLRSTATPLVFVTHHHRVRAPPSIPSHMDNGNNVFMPCLVKDHVEAIHVVTALFPTALLVAHKKTLEYMSKEGYTHNNTLGLTDKCTLKIGSENIEALTAEGHTDGHMALFHRKSRTLIAGDHLAGYGSVVLDMVCATCVKGSLVAVLHCEVEGPDIH